MILGQLPVPEHDPAQVREAAREVLARPEYQRPGPSVLERIRDWVVEQIERVLGAVVDGGQATVVALVILLAALGIVAFLVVRFARGVTPDAAQKAEHRPRRRRTPAEWRAEADAHARAGRWRDAVRYRYRALVAELGTRGLLDEIPGRTAGEYRAEVAGSAPDVAPAFSQASDVFETAWYGHRPTAEEHDARLRELSDRVLQDSR